MTEPTFIELAVPFPTETGLLDTSDTRPVLVNVAQIVSVDADDLGNQNVGPIHRVLLSTGMEILVCRGYDDILFFLGDVAAGTH